MTALEEDYQTATATGDGWTLHLGDSCERLREVSDRSVDLSVYSPPFASLYTYSDSLRDMGNSKTRSEFFEHYGFVVREVLRATKPGRLAVVHVSDVALTKAVQGYMGLYDFPGDVIRAHKRAGWIFYGRALVDKNPQAQAIRTKSHALMFVTKNRDSSATRPAIGDHLLIFKKPGTNAVPIKTDVTNDEWIQWARPIWKGLSDEETVAAMEREGLVPAPGWYGVNETRTLNHRSARHERDEKHICPLQLDFIERCVRLWSNPGETVLSPFAGVGSEVYTAVKLGRRGIGVELKPSYFRTAIENMKGLAVT
jgi:DNA modification methylase